MKKKIIFSDSWIDKNLPNLSKSGLLTGSLLSISNTKDLLDKFGMCEQNESSIVNLDNTTEESDGKPTSTNITENKSEFFKIISTAPTYFMK